MLNRDDHDAIVSRLYAAAAGEAPWQSALGCMADQFGHSAAVLTMVDTAKGVLAAKAHGRPNDFANAFYQSETYRRDPRSTIHVAVKPGQIYYDHALYDVKSMLRDARVRETIELIGVSHQIGLSLRLPHGAPGMFTLLSTEEEGPASEAVVTAFRRLAPHIEQACFLGEILEREAGTQALLLEAVAGRADGVVLLNAAGLPGFVNAAAEQILAAGDGLGWSGGRFTTARGAETRRLHVAIRNAIVGQFDTSAGTPGGQLVVTRPSGRRPYLVRVLPAPPLERLLSRFSFACVIHIHDLAAVRLPPRGLLIEAFGLTGREADLAIELVRCAGLAGAAVQVGMTHNTARNHLQSIFRKCGVATQAEAVQLFSRLA